MSTLGPLLSTLLLLPAADSVPPEAPRIRSVWETRGTDPDKVSPSVSVSNAPLSIRVERLKGRDDLTNVAVVTIGMDGNAVKHKEKPEWQPENATAVFRLPFLPRGKHTLRVVRTDGPGLQSQDVSLEVGFPPAPTIVSLYEKNGHPAPLPKGGAALPIRSNGFIVELTGAETDKEIVILVNGKVVKLADSVEPVENRYRVPIDSSQWPTGTYAVTARVARGGDESDDAKPAVKVNYDPCPEEKPAPPAPSPKPPEAPQTAAPQPALAPAPIPSPGRGIALQMCKSTDAFPLLPLVRLVPDPNRPRRSDQEPPTEEEELNRLEPWARFRGIPVYDARFDGPAQFPLPWFGRFGERLDGEGVVVYEGMRFLAAADGHYEVQFTVTTPAMPVTLRLQLFVVDPLGRSFPLTLPPIAIDPVKTFEGNYLGSAFQVSHAGFSRQVALHFAELGYCTLARQGTARFGSWPQDVNRFGALPALGPATEGGQASGGTAQGMASPTAGY